MVQPRQGDDELVDAPEVRRLLGNVSEMWLRRRLDPVSRYYDAEFPQPVQYHPGGPRHWPRGEVLAYRERMRRGAEHRDGADRHRAVGTTVRGKKESLRGTEAR
jgi:hypothetical protein